jgi:hypothetical protein
VSPGIRKCILAVHISVSVGWIGAAAVYLLLVAGAMTSTDSQVWRVAWGMLALIGWSVLIPLAALALLTGVAIALYTSWGIVRHYWVLASLLLTALATIVLVRHMFDVSAMARLAVTVADPSALRAGFRNELIHAGLGLAVLIGIEVLNVYKPRGLTPFGRILPDVATAARVSTPVASRPRAGRQPLWLRAVTAHVIMLALLAGVLHIAGSRLPH